ncbi:YIEGIA family protein [Cohnella lubricantis]|uniref:YIEGIA domain-containing protein n=1 Tax=Cohnella lubricantis TaxID=2163172 RepID=A0A841TEJ2_9BACL|nr:YIEGIA family protein [Cohnella lubricantis]MBB6677728.1 YIEGIA domain-containing protein [Cohnella lubricantis]
MPWLLSHPDLAEVSLGTFAGVATRYLMLRSDYRQYPSYPHGRIIHLALGLIAGALGAVAVPALFDKNYTAITFLGMAAQQFRDVRNMERNTLTALDAQELVPRGAAYIEGIAVVFEGRNYLSIFAAFLTSLIVTLAGWAPGILVGALCLATAIRFRKGKKLEDVAKVEAAPVRIDGPNLLVGDVYMMNVGLNENRDIIGKQAIGFILTPKNDDARVTLANLGQRQAILHDVSTRLGVYRDDGEPMLLPMAKLGLASGKLGVLFLPREHDPEKALASVSSVPLLESAIRKPVEANRRAEEKAVRGG